MAPPYQRANVPPAGIRLTLSTLGERVDARLPLWLSVSGRRRLRAALICFPPRRSLHDGAEPDTAGANPVRLMSTRTRSQCGGEWVVDGSAVCCRFHLHRVRREVRVALASCRSMSGRLGVRGDRATSSGMRSSSRAAGVRDLTCRVRVGRSRPRICRSSNRREAGVSDDHHRKRWRRRRPTARR